MLPKLGADRRAFVRDFRLSWAFELLHTFAIHALIS